MEVCDAGQGGRDSVRSLRVALSLVLGVRAGLGHDQHAGGSPRRGGLSDRVRRATQAARYASSGSIEKRTSTIPSANALETRNPDSAKTWSISRFSGSVVAMKVVTPFFHAASARHSSNVVPIPWCWY